MTAPSIPTRLAQIAEREDGSGAADEINSLGFDEQQERTETTLKQLSGAFDGEWESSSVEQEVDDYFVCSGQLELTVGRCIRASLAVCDMVVQHDVRVL